MIAGASSGFGQTLAREALDAGHRVVDTVRSEGARSALEAMAPGRAFDRLLDVADLAAIESTVTAIEHDIGPLGVLVDSVGCGHKGILGESSPAEMRRRFEVNLFDTVTMIQAVLPYMRRCRRDHIFNITFVGDYITMPSITYYCGNRSTLEGVSGALNREVAGLGIAITTVTPGSFRTDWAGRLMVRGPCTIAGYGALPDPVHQTHQEKNGKQPGDPREATCAILQAIDTENPPAHLLLGSGALGPTRQKLKTLEEEVAAWGEVTRSTDE